MDPFGKALKDFFNTKKKNFVYILRDDGLKEEHAISYYFREENEINKLEQVALDLCKGKILDFGAGAGPHSLILQQRGFDVFALDISSEACEIMEQRGVKKVLNQSIYSIEGKKFDTILALGRSIGNVGTISGLEHFLRFIPKIMNSGGQIILDAGDIRKTDNPIHLNYQRNNEKNGKYFGEIRFQIEYKGIKGQMFEMLQIDPDKLRKICSCTNWKAKIIIELENGNYLAQLTMI